MKIKAQLNYLHIAPRKVRLVADLIRRKPARQAKAILEFSKKKSAKHLIKLLASALANAKHNFDKAENDLYISAITVDEGPVFKRYRAKWRGTAHMIRKKTSHVAVELDERKDKNIKT